MKISLVMCTRNRQFELNRFIESLFLQTLQIDEFILVDSSDEDKKLDMESTNSKFLKQNMIIKYVHSLPGLTLQRNIGVKLASGDILFFFDDDIVLDKDYIEKISNVFTKYPSMLGGMGFIKNEGRNRLKRNLGLLYKRFFFLSNDFGSGKFYLSGLASNTQGLKEFSVTEVLQGGIAAYKKEVFSKNLFDENLSKYGYLEDVDFSRRISYEGELFHCPDAICLHLHGEGGRGDIFQNRKMFIRNHRYLFVKNIIGNTDQKMLAEVTHWWSIVGYIMRNVSHPMGMLGAISGIFEYNKMKKIANYENRN